MVLNLHRVSPERNPFWDPLDPQVFEELLVFLKRHFHVTTFSELASREAKPALILSFDDGYYGRQRAASLVVQKKEDGFK